MSLTNAIQGECSSFNSLSWKKCITKSSPVTVMKKKTLNNNMNEEKQNKTNKQTKKTDEAPPQSATGLNHVTRGHC